MTGPADRLHSPNAPGPGPGQRAPRLSSASRVELEAAARRLERRLEAIADGAPATPDSAPAARRALETVRAELARRFDPWADVTDRRG